MKRLLLVAALLLAAPINAQELDLTVQATLSAGADSSVSTDRGYTAQLRHGGFSWIHPVLAFHYLEHGEGNDLFVAAGARLLLPFDLFLQWTPGWENLHAKDVDGRWAAVLTGGLTISSVGLYGSWYYSFQTEKATPQVGAVGIMWRIGG